MTIKDKKLLNNRKVVEEIRRHLWIESEKVGRDIGFEIAAEDWLEKFSKTWMNYHMPKRKAPTVTATKKSTKASAKFL